MRPSTHSFLLALLLAAVPTFVRGHAYVQNVNPVCVETIAGKEYTGWLPFTMPYSDPIGKSIVRNVPGDSPILDVKSRSLACNEGGEKPAALIANANAGDVLKFTLNTWPSDHVGPVTIYMANCNGNCMNFDPSEGAVWFKVDQDAMTNGVWGTHRLMKQGNSWSVTIPKTIKSGQYLIRLELVALHDVGQPQFYPSCTQVNIKSSGSSVPSPGDLVAIPGLYINAGKAIYGDVWSSVTTTRPIVGPAVVSWAKGGHGGGGSYEITPSVPTSTKSVPPEGSKVSTTPSIGPKPSPTTRPKRCKKHDKDGGRRGVPPSLVGADAPRGMVKRVIRAAANAAERRSQDDGIEHVPAPPASEVYRRHVQILKNKRGATGMRVPS